MNDLIVANRKNTMVKEILMVINEMINLSIQLYNTYTMNTHDLFTQSKEYNQSICLIFTFFSLTYPNKIIQSKEF